MSDTRDYLSRRIGDLEVSAATHQNNISRLSREREHMLAELEEARAAYAAIEALDETEEAP